MRAPFSVGRTIDRLEAKASEVSISVILKSSYRLFGMV
jgi:hypothetical protein